MSKKRAAAKIDRYADLLKDVKSRIQHAQTRAILAVNAELLRLYWDIGRVIAERQKEEGWGAGIIPRLALELKNDLPELKGFSERNIGLMIAFYNEYPNPGEFLQQVVAKLAGRENLPQTAPILQQAVAKLGPATKVKGAVSQPRSDTVSPQTPAKKGVSDVLPQPATKVQQSVAQPSDSLLWSIPWGHHALLIARVKDLLARRWYMEQTLAHGWSRNILAIQIDARAHMRHGKAVTNFVATLPAPQSDLAQQALKDPYIFDFLTLTEPFQEREFETGLIGYLEKFLLELGHGFASVGRQHRFEVGDEDFYVDLLFYHLRLRAFVVIDLKKGKFKPEYAGKLNFYCNIVNERLRHPTDAPTIGLILCQSKDNLLAEYSFAG